jgi:kynurenine 3-monooxygenase
MTAAPLAIVGGGLAGSLLGILLARRGLAPVVIERQASFDETAAARGRSINLALAARGIEALRRAGIFAEIEPLLIPMGGRLLHEDDGAERFLPYGQRREERIYSVSRAGLNHRLCEIARDRHGVEYRFGHECTGLAAGAARIESPRGPYALEAEFLVAADGAGSSVRKALQESGTVRATEDFLDHGYKELTLPPTRTGELALAPNALHIWPRGGFMLIALPNLDRSFTATLFLPLAGPTSFASVDARGVREFFMEHFPDALPLFPELETEYRKNPVGHLGTLTCRPWSHAGRVLLLGDAAHAIVPFHGQGMNAAFEDCTELDRLIGEFGRDWARICTLFERNRAGNAAAIAAMALENYREMREDVRSAAFRLKAELAFELERRHPQQFIPRYAMVMFHPEISYAEARRRGAVQAEILDALTRDARSLEDVDFALAAKLVSERL